MKQVILIYLVFGFGMIVQVLQMYNVFYIPGAPSKVKYKEVKGKYKLLFAIGFIPIWPLWFVGPAVRRLPFAFDKKKGF